MNPSDTSSEASHPPAPIGKTTQEKPEEWGRRTGAQFRSGATWENSRKASLEHANRIRAGKGWPLLGPEDAEN